MREAGRTSLADLTCYIYYTAPTMSPHAGKYSAAGEKNGIQIAHHYASPFVKCHCLHASFRYRARRIDKDVNSTKCALDRCDQVLDVPFASDVHLSGVDVTAGLQQP